MTTPLTITSLNQGKIAPALTSDETYWAHFDNPPKPASDAMPQQAAQIFSWVRFRFPGLPVKG